MYACSLNLPFVLPGPLVVPWPPPPHSHACLIDVAFLSVACHPISIMRLLPPLPMFSPGPRSRVLALLLFPPGSSCFLAALGVCMCVCRVLRVGHPASYRVLRNDLPLSAMSHVVCPSLNLVCANGFSSCPASRRSLISLFPSDLSYSLFVSKIGMVVCRFSASRGMPLRPLLPLEFA